MYRICLCDTAELYQMYVTRYILCYNPQSYNYFLNTLIVLITIIYLFMLNVHEYCHEIVSRYKIVVKKNHRKL